MPQTTSEPKAHTKVYEAVNDELAALGVEVAFGLMGEDTAALITDLIDRVGIAFHGTRHESVAISAADGYAWATGALGVCILSRGPGLTNGATAAVTAAKAGRSVLIIAGDQSTRIRPRPSPGPDLKQFDHAGLAQACGVTFRRASEPSHVRAMLREAASIVAQGTTALLTIPFNVLGGELSASGAPAIESGERTATQGEPAIEPGERTGGEPPRAGQREIAAALALLRESERPLILAGGGAVRAGAKRVLEDLASSTGALLCTTLCAKDLFRDSPYDLGILGGFSLPGPRRLIGQADLLLAFGARMTSFTTCGGRLLKGVPVVQIDTEASHLGRYAAVRLGIVADARTTAQQLLDAISASRAHAHLDASTQAPDSSLAQGPSHPPAQAPSHPPAQAPSHPPAAAQSNGSAEPPFHRPQALAQVSMPPLQADCDDSARPVDPRTLCARLDQMLPGDRVILSDGGHHVGFSAMYMRVRSPDRFRFTLDFASVGMGLGAAIGAALARPESQTVLFIGDGGLLMTLGDLETVARCRLPLLIVVMNDCAYGAERHFLDLAGLSHRHAQFPDVDFAMLAGSLGLRAARVDSLSDLDALSETLRENLETPLLIDCKTDPALRAEWLDEL